MSTIETSHLDQRIDRHGVARVYVSGTRLRVQDIAAEHELEGLTPEQIVREFPHLSLGQVHAALSYYFDHREQILAEVQADALFAESLRERFKKPDINQSGSTDAPADSVSPS